MIGLGSDKNRLPFVHFLNIHHASMFLGILINKRLMKPCRVSPPLQILVLASKREKLVVSGTRREIMKEHCREAHKNCDSRLRIFYITEVNLTVSRSSVQKTYEN